MKIWCDTLAANGYLSMTIDYYSLDVNPGPTIDTSAAYPWQATTFKLAVEFLRHNANRFNIFTDQIVGFGMSGGAVHWGQCIIWDNDDEFFQTDPTINDHVDAAVLLYGFYDNFNFQPSWSVPLLVKHFALNPAYQATRGNCIANVERITTPVILLHGTNDVNVYYQQSVQLHDSLTALGKNSQLVSFPGLAHVFDLTSPLPPHSFTPAGLVAKDSILSFLDRTLQFTSIITQESVIDQIHLYQNYPNPFNPSTTIEFALTKPGWVTLKIYNILGQEVAELVSENLGAGSYKYNWDASGLASGVYYYRIEADKGFVQTKKMLLIR
jgi:dienelactone hydrolase